MSEVELRLREVLKEVAEEQQYQNSEVELKAISSGGANYTSQLFTVTLSAPGKDELKLFTKIATIGEKMRSVTSMDVFNTEITFYTQIVPKYKELEEVHNFSVEDRIVMPKYYGGTTEYLKEMLILEDCTAKGFKAFDRFKCFDWNYAATCVSALARLHALSVAFEKNEPEDYSKFVATLKSEKTSDGLKDFLKKSIVTAVKCTDEAYREKVEIFLKNDLKKDVIAKFYQPERRLVLIHGDFRPSNILHKVDDSGQLSVVLVDYQVIQRGNPVTDLLYFLINGSDEEFREKHLHQYFNYYYEVFSKTLKRLGLDPEEVYKEVDYRSDVKEMLPFGLSLGMFTLPFVTVDESNAPKPEQGIDVGSFNIEVSDLFRTRFNGLVRDYIKLGIL